MQIRGCAHRMRGLIHQEDQRGAAAIIVGVAMFGLIGMAAYVIDVGSLFEERRDLQNGADAAALALAYDCAAAGGVIGTGDCAANADTEEEADRLAGWNSNDGEALVEQDDIRFGVDSDGTPCSDCVTVTTHTWDDLDNDGEIDYVLAPVLGSNSKAVSAQATAKWVYAGSGFGFPMTISECEWDAATNDGLVWGEEIILLFHIGNGLTPPEDEIQCPDEVGNAYQDVPGGFGSLDGVDCLSNIDGSGYVSWDGGDDGPQGQDCEPEDAYLQTIYVPIYEEIVDASFCGAQGGGPNSRCYRIAGFGEFFVTRVWFNGVPGWRQPQSGGYFCDEHPNHDDYIPGQSGSCIGGHFVQRLTLAEGLLLGGGGNFGAASIGLSG